MIYAGVNMEIIIKQKTPITKNIAGADGENTTISILSIYFDVLTPDTAYVDNDDIGYFPIEIAADMNTPDADVITACEKWITDNDVLSHYTGKLRNRDEDIQTEIEKTHSITDEIGIIRKALAKMLPDDVDIQAWNNVVVAAKAKYPKE